MHCAHLLLRASADRTRRGGMDVNTRGILEAAHTRLGFSSLRPELRRLCIRGALLYLTL